MSTLSWVAKVPKVSWILVTVVFISSTVTPILLRASVLAATAAAISSSETPRSVDRSVMALASASSLLSPAASYSSTFAARESTLD